MVSRILPGQEGFGRRGGRHRGAGVALHDAHFESRLAGIHGAGGRGERRRDGLGADQRGAGGEGQRGQARSETMVGCHSWCLGLGVRAGSSIPATRRGLVPVWVVPASWLGGRVTRAARPAKRSTGPDDDPDDGDTRARSRWDMLIREPCGFAAERQAASSVEEAQNEEGRACARPSCRGVNFASVSRGRILPHRWRPP